MSKIKKVIGVVRKVNPFGIAFRAGMREGTRGDPMFSALYRPIIKKIRKR